MPFGAADVDVVQPVAVHVRDRQGRAFARQHVGNERLAAVVVERVLLVLEIEGDPVRHVGEQRPRGPARIPIPPSGIPLRERERAVGGHVRQHLIAPIGPDDGQRVDLRRRAEPEVQARIDRGFEAAGGHLLHELGRAVLPDDDLRADPSGVGSRAAQRHRQIGVVVDLARVVAVDRGGGVEVVHDQVERAAVVQVGVHGAVREPGLRQAPGLRHVRERQVAVVAIGVVRDGDVGHQMRQAPQQPRADAGRQSSLDGGVAHRCEVVEVVGPAIDAVGNEEVFVPVVVQVREQGRPAPVGRVHAGQIADLAEAHRSSHRAAVELQGVAGVLRVVAGLLLHVFDRPRVGVDGGLEDVLLLGQHVEHHQVRSPVVVVVGDIDAHRGMAGVPQRRGAGLGKRAVTVVDVEKVVLLEVIGDVQVGAAIEVHVARDHAQAVPLDAPVDVGLGAHIHEMAPVVAEQPVAGPRMAWLALRVRALPALGVGGVVEEVHVQVAVAVVVEKHGLGGVAGEVESILLGAVGEGAVAVVDVQDVVAVHREMTHGGDVDVQAPVAVDVGHGDAGLPAIGICHAGALGDVLEPVVPQVPVQPIGTHVRGEVEIRKAVAVDIAHGDTAAVVVVEEVDDVERGILLRDCVDERDAGGAGGQELEQRRGVRAPATGGQQQKQTRNAEVGTGNSERLSRPGSAFRVPRSHLPYRAGRIRIAWPPPGARTRRKREAAVTARWEIETGSGFVSQLAPGPSA